MLRFIIKRSVFDGLREQYPERETSHETLLLNVPELEAALTRGGFGPSGSDRSELLGVEIVKGG